MGHFHGTAFARKRKTKKHAKRANALPAKLGIAAQPWGKAEVVAKVCAGGGKASGAKQRAWRAVDSRHRFKFIDAETGEETRATLTDYQLGIENWKESERNAFALNSHPRRMFDKKELLRQAESVRDAAFEHFRATRKVR